MKQDFKYIILSLAVMLILASCNTLEKASMHGFNSGYYNFKYDQKNTESVYADVSEDKIEVYHQTNKLPEKNSFLTIPLNANDTAFNIPMVFKKKSLDIDITAILLKYHPSVYDLPGQMTTDFNLALYAGWRFDNYILKYTKDPLGKNYRKVINRGYDFGVFSGVGSTLISPFTTQNKRADEYNGMVIQYGIAGFLESNIASFGIATGFDYLLNTDREIWIYNNKPWVGFIVGFPLN